MTGFRVARGGAQALYAVEPDLTTLGKIVGGGMPVGAFGGRRDIMDQIAPLGPIYQAGTLSGQPAWRWPRVSPRSPKSTINLSTIVLPQRRSASTSGLAAAAQRHNVPVRINSVCGMFSLFFTSQRRSARSRRRLGVGREPIQPVFSRACSRAESTWRRPHSKRDSSAPRTMTARITATLEAADVALAEVAR